MEGTNVENCPLWPQNSRPAGISILWVKSENRNLKGNLNRLGFCEILGELFCRVCPHAGREYSGSGCTGSSRSSSSSRSRCGGRRAVSVQRRNRQRRHFRVVNNMVIQAVQRKFKTIGNAQLVVDFAQIILHDL